MCAVQAFAFAVVKLRAALASATAERQANSKEDCVERCRNVWVMKSYNWCESTEKPDRTDSSAHQKQGRERARQRWAGRRASWPKPEATTQKDKQQNNEKIRKRPIRVGANQSSTERPVLSSHREGPGSPELYSCLKSGCPSFFTILICATKMSVKVG